MKARLFSIAAAAFLTIAVPLAAAHDCAMEEPLASLDDCITHHYEEGEIATSGVYASLLSKAKVAQDAAANGQEDVAVLVLDAFIAQVNALSGRQVTGEAVHLVHHAEAAIESLGTQR